MKKIILSISLGIGLGLCAIAQTSDKIGVGTISSDKSFMTGAGICYSINLGTTIKCDYILNETVTLGIRPILSGYSYKDYISDTVNTDAFTITRNHGGHVNSFFVTSTVYLLGFCTESQGGFYVTLGAGYLNRKFSTAVTEKHGMGSYNRNLQNKSFAGLFCLGEDYFIGPGRFFLEAPLSMEIYGSQISNLNNTAGNYIQPGTAKTTSYRKFKVYPFVSLGYTLYF